MGHGPRHVGILGVALIVIAIAHAGFKLTGGGTLLEAAIEFGVISVAGLVVLYVGSWLSSSEIDPRHYPRIAGWCLGGVGVMLVFLLLRALHPGVANPFSAGTRAIGVALGSIAGLGIGIHDARARTREQEVAERNEELQRIRDELEEALRRVEASNERLEHFASVASHDLREPLRMISSYLQLLEERYGDELDEEASEFLAFAADGADRLQGMVESLLAYSRVETQGAPFEPVDLDRVLDDVRTDLEFLIDEHDAELSADPLPRVHGDEDQLRQVIQNLLTNAIEYSDGRPRIEISAEANGDEWIISVRDEGTGIDPDDQERIFEVFERASLDGDGGGSGIGLALCRWIVERHRGEIWVESEPGTGSTFSFTLPRMSQTSSREDRRRERGQPAIH